MRLFIAVDFDGNTKTHLQRITEDLKTKSKVGTFTRRENYHITLAFIGESNEPQKIRAAMDEIHSEPFKLKLNRLGSFKRDRGDIVFVNIENPSALDNVNKQLIKALEKKGIILEKRTFKPHLTLGRQVVFSGEFNLHGYVDVSLPITAEVPEITLMKSERINGVLTYTPVYSRPLKLKI